MKHCADGMAKNFVHGKGDLLCGGPLFVLCAMVWLWAAHGLRVQCTPVTGHDASVGVTLFFLRRRHRMHGRRVCSGIIDRL